MRPGVGGGGGGGHGRSCRLEAQCNVRPNAPSLHEPETDLSKIMNVYGKPALKLNPLPLPCSYVHHDSPTFIVNTVPKIEENL
jgi:hypothetical protein